MYIINLELYTYNITITMKTKKLIEENTVEIMLSDIVELKTVVLNDNKIMLEYKLDDGIEWHAELSGVLLDDNMEVYGYIVYLY